MTTNTEKGKVRPDEKIINKFSKGDLIYDTETDELGIICAVHKQKGCLTSYNIETLYEWDGRYHHGEVRLNVYNYDNQLTLISKQEFK